MHSPAALTQFLRDTLDGEVANGMEVVASSGMNITVKAGTASVGKDPSYDINIAGTETVNIGAASPSNPTNTLIVAYVDRDVAGSTAVTDNTNDVFKLKAVSGAAAATPSDPTTSAIQAAIGAANPFIILARVRKQAGATSVAEGDITDLRKMITLRDGRINKPEIISNGTIVSKHIKDDIILPQNLSPSARGDRSTSEVDTGMKWIDGRTIYQKTFEMGGLKVAGKTTKPHGIKKLDMVINIRGIAKEDSIGATINLPHAADQQAYAVTVYADNNNINIQTYADQSGYKTSFVTIQYVKKS
nr:MAG TPA: hypothetical protein [Caudoviricetes sp.]